MMTKQVMGWARFSCGSRLPPLLALCAYLPASVLAAGESPLGQAYISESSVRDAVNGSPESSAAAARNAFSEGSGAAAVKLGGRGTRSFVSVPKQTTPPRNFEASAKAPPTVYAAKEDEKPPPNTWDREGTLSAAAVGLAGAIIGFMLGGPIGACAGFLAAFFFGAALWKGCSKPRKMESE